MSKTKYQFKCATWQTHWYITYTYDNQDPREHHIDIRFEDGETTMRFFHLGDEGSLNAREIMSIIARRFSDIGLMFSAGWDSVREVEAFEV